MIILIFLVAIFWNFGSGYYEGKWLGFGACFALLLCNAINKKFGIAAAVTVFYLLASSWWLLFFPGNRFAKIDGNHLASLKLFTAVSSLQMLLIVCPLLILNISEKKFHKLGAKISTAFCAISVGQIFWEWATRGCAGENVCGGPLMNPSLNAGMMVVTLPIVLNTLGRFSWPLVALAGVAIGVSKTSIGLGMFSLFLLAHFLCLKNWKVLLVAPAVFALGWWRIGSLELFSFGDRDVMWKFFMENWAHNKQNWAFGTGFGTFGVFSYLTQETFQMRDQYWWIWLHSDALQAVFEIGVVGAALLLSVFVAAARGLYIKGLRAEFMSFLLFGVTMTVNYPLHIALPCAFAAWLTCLGLMRQNSLQPGDIEYDVC